MSGTGKVILKVVGIVAIIAILIVGGFFALKYLVIKPRIEKKITEAVKSNLGSEYQFKYSDYTLNLLDGKIQFKEVYITKPAALKEHIKKGITEVSKLSFYFEEITATGIHFLDAFLNKKIVINLLQFYNPILLHIAGEDFSSKGVDGKLKLIKINKIEFISGEYKRINEISGKNTAQVVIPDFNLVVDSLYADLTDTAKTQPFQVHNFIYTVNKPEVKSPNGSYIITASKVKGSKIAGTATLNNFKMVPTISKSELPQQENGDGTWIKVTTDNLNISGIKYNDLIYNTVFYASVVDANGFNIYGYQNKNLDQDDQSSKKRMPQEILKNIEFKFSVDKLNIENGLVEYTEVSAKSDEAGIITFKNLSSTVENITNIQEIYQQQPELLVEASTEVLGLLHLEAKAIFDMTGESNKFRSTGSAGSISLPQFNQITVPVAYIKINEGQLNQATYSFEGDENSATGRMKFLYNNLDLQILDKQTLQSGFLNEVKSFIGDIFVVEDSNPSDGELRIAEIDFKRDDSKSFLSYYWKILLTGIREAIGAGFKNKEETTSKEKEVAEKEKEEGLSEEDQNIIEKVIDELTGEDEKKETEKKVEKQEESKIKSFFKKIFESIKEFLKKIFNKVF